MADDSVTPKDIYEALTNAGASTIQAVAIMGNMIAESGLNPEASATDSNGYQSVGLVQWNLASYPNASSLVTGNPAKDLKAQVTYLAQTGGFSAASGSTPTAAASNFARNYERCSTCGSGGAENQERQSNAQQVAGWAAQGDWPASIGSASDTATLTSAETSQESSECLWGFGGSTGKILFFTGPSINVCLLDKTQGRAIIGSLIFVSGAMLGLFGLAALLITTVGESPAARKVVEAGTAAAAFMIPK